MKYLALAALAATTTLGGVAVAAQKSAPLKADVNGDGAISRAEFIARADARFARLDTDRNGTLSGAEHRFGHRIHGKRARFMGAQDMPDGQPGAGRGAMLQRFDADRDGKLSRAEFAAQANQRWSRLDANGNGKIDEDERRGRGMAALTDRASFDKQTEARFARVDANGDGFIDAAEAQAIARGMRAGPRADRRAAPGAKSDPIITTAPTPSDD